MAFFETGSYCILGLAAAYVSAYLVYHLILLLAHFVIKNETILPLKPKTRFAIVIPAHDEELFLKRLIKSIYKQNYPRELLTVTVVADNCTDNTAEIALQNGARVCERIDNVQRGKGHAIKFGLERLRLQDYDAVFVIDADSVVEDDLFFQLDNKIQRGNMIIQCYNGVANPEESWFTRLLDVSRTIGNEIYHPGKQKLGLSSYLMGNGMCFSSSVLEKYGWNAFTIGEDWEFYAKLVLSGETVAFANKARVYHQESTSLKQATSQRMRWSGGRFAIAWKYGTKLMCEGLAEKNIKKIDGALPLLLPNPSLGMNITIAGLIVSFVPFAAFDSGLFLGWFFVLMLVQIFLFITGIAYTRHKLKNFLSLFASPLFLLWKTGIDIFSALGFARTKWTRTERKL
jgi:cellulose synthase/poly-beta-1,6-N-acetylglucosamine synthase-like glycosyltransferase